MPQRHRPRMRPATPQRSSIHGSETLTIARLTLRYSRPQSVAIAAIAALRASEVTHCKVCISRLYRWSDSDCQVQVWVSPHNRTTSSRLDAETHLPRSPFGIPKRTELRNPISSISQPVKNWLLTSFDGSLGDDPSHKSLLNLLFHQRKTSFKIEYKRI